MWAQLRVTNLNTEQLEQCRKESHVYLTYQQVLRRDRFQGGLIQSLYDVIKVYSTLVSAHS